MNQPVIAKTNPAPASTSDQELRSLLSEGTILRCNEPMARRTTLRVGGPADIYVEPCSESDLAILIRWCAEKSVPWFMLGRGSNLLVRDGGIRGVVVCLGTAFGQVAVEGEKLICGAGARLKTVSNVAKEHCLAGLEFLEGIPGTVGGALRMNAGAMGSWIFDVVERVRTMKGRGELFERAPAEMKPTYRQCETLKHEIALSAILHGVKGVRAQIQQRMDEFSRKRWQSQPAAASAGCIFKNPGTIPAGKLIDELGLKGLRVGGAVVSSEHGNFMVNEGNATAQNVLDLIERLTNRAKAIRGVELETEVQIVGE
jgi:UDP-N-acetylenolpyruvoylglucosamine reductase